MDNKHACWFNTVDLSDFSNKVEVLFELGHFISSTYPDTSDKVRKDVIEDCKSESCLLFREGTLSLQRHSDLKTDSYFGSLTAKSVNARFCPLPDRRAAGARSNWSFHDLTVWHDMEDLSGFDEVEMYMTACNVWGNPHTPLTFKFWQDDTDRKPNLFAHARRIDGPGKILAWHQLPPPNAGRNVQLEGRFDTGEQWAVFWQLLSTMIHEIGHGLGLDHSTNPNDIMYHTINGTKMPAAGDVRAIQRIYGRGEPVPPPPPPPPPPPDDDDVEIIGRQLHGRTKDGRDFYITHSLEK